LNDDPPKRSFGRRETSGPPVIPHGALFSVGRPRYESGESEPGTHEVRVHVVVWVADVGWTHRASSSARGRKTDWCKRALARKKSVAPPDAGRGWVEGETVRVCAGSSKSFRVHGLWVFGSQVLDTTKGVLGLMPVLLSPAGRSRGPLARRFNSASQSARSVITDSTSGGYGFRLGCACG